MNATPRLVTVALSLTVIASSPAQTIVPDIVVNRNTDPSGSTWSIVPFIRVEDVAAHFFSTASDDSQVVAIEAPNGFAGGRSDAGSYAAQFPSFAELESEATSAPWTLVLDPDGSPQTFEFDLSFPDLDESMFSEVLLIQPGNLNDVPADSPEFSWTGAPDGAGWINFILQREDWEIVVYEWLDVSTTSYAYASTLDPGNYRLTIRYVTPLTSDHISLSEPVEQDGTATLPGATGYSWSPVVSAWSEGSYLFTVVPEPSSLLLCSLGLAGLCVRRR